MRLWSLHPGYLDAKGLVALWREGLLARKALLGRTKGYRSHPQLSRFSATKSPVAAIDCYLRAVLDEASRRGYAFSATKLGRRRACARLTVTRGQLRFETHHLLAKLKRRDPSAWRKLLDVGSPRAHPFFRVVPGPIEPWEKSKSAAR